MANIGDVERIVKALRAERINQNKTQTDIGNEIGYTQTYISQLESGTRKKFSTAILLRYANALGTPLPVIIWRASSEEDVPQEKREIYKSLKPSIDELIKTVFG